MVRDGCTEDDQSGIQIQLESNAGKIILKVKTANRFLVFPLISKFNITLPYSDLTGILFCQFQSIGRVLRHANDFGVVALLDQRYIFNLSSSPKFLASDS